jgi:glycolate oxidase iron-sulfur subunit
MTHPEISARLSRRKMENIKRTGAQVAITSNAGCALQIAREAREQNQRLAVVHPMELLDWSYRGETPKW